MDFILGRNKYAQLRTKILPLSCNRFYLLCKWILVSQALLRSVPTPLRTLVERKVVFGQGLGCRLSLQTWMPNAPAILQTSHRGCIETPSHGLETESSLNAANMILTHSVSEDEYKSKQLTVELLNHLIETVIKISIKNHSPNEIATFVTRHMIPQHTRKWRKSSRKPMKIQVDIQMSVIVFLRSSFKLLRP